MKNAHIKTIFRKISFICLVCFFFSNCGLDVIEYYYPPTNNINSQFALELNQTDFYDTNPVGPETYIKFIPNNLGNIDSATFKGTDIYYKIYNNIDNALSNAKSIRDLIIIDNQYSMKSTETMLNYGYKKLRKMDNSEKIISEDCLIPKDLGDVPVVFFPGYNSPSYLKIGDDSYTPIRYINPLDKKLNFEFFDYKNKYDRQVYQDSTTDIDISLSEDNYTKEGTWYIVLFAVGTGLDFTFTEQYSAVLYLGCLPLIENN